MTLLNTLNVGGTDFGILNNTVMGVCATPAGNEIKDCSFADNFELKAGVIVTIKFTYTNTYGNGSTTYPKLTVNGITGAIRNVTGEYASNGAWNNQALVPFLFDGTDFTLLITNVTDTVASNNKYSVSSDAVADSCFYKAWSVLTDDETEDVVLDYGTYLFVNAHVFAFELTMFSLWSDDLRVTPLIPASTTFTQISNGVRLTASGPCRGAIFKLGSLSDMFS